MSTGNRTFGRRKTYGVSPRRRRKQDLVTQSETCTNLAFEDFIPPENTIPLGFHVRSAILVVHGSSSAKTPRERRRRRIRWLVWDFSDRSQHLRFKRSQEPSSSNEAPLSEIGRKRDKGDPEIYVRQNREQGLSKNSSVSKSILLHI